MAPSERIARVGGGARSGGVIEPRHAELGLAALHGSSPDVGIVGYTLGGGISWSGANTACRQPVAVSSS